MRLHRSLDWGSARRIWLMLSVLLPVFAALFCSWTAGYEDSHSGNRLPVMTVSDERNRQMTTPLRVVSIRSIANGRYVSAELGYTGDDYGMLRARAYQVGDWEQFDLIAIDEETFALRSHGNGKYVSAELGYTDYKFGMPRARADEVHDWEKFHLETSGSQFALRLPIGANYVSAELGYTDANYGMLRARADQASDWEQFTF